MASTLRLSPTSASLKRLALEFIKRYWADLGCSPSYGEIAAALGTNRERVRVIVHQLARDGEVKLTGGRRGILLPDLAERFSESDALRRLSELGWTHELGRLYPPQSLTNSTMPLLAELRHIPDVDIGDIQHGQQRRAGQRRSRA